MRQEVSKMEVSAPGPLDYTVRVINTSTTEEFTNVVLRHEVKKGDVTEVLDNLTVDSGDTDSDGVLDVGESWVYEFSIQVTQADIDNDADIENFVFLKTDQTSQETSAINSSVEPSPDFDIKRPLTRRT